MTHAILPREVSKHSWIDWCSPPRRKTHPALVLTRLMMILFQGQGRRNMGKVPTNILKMERKKRIFHQNHHPPECFRPIPRIHMTEWLQNRHIIIIHIKKRGKLPLLLLLLLTPSCDSFVHRQNILDFIPLIQIKKIECLVEITMCLLRLSIPPQPLQPIRLFSLLVYQNSPSHRQRHGYNTITPHMFIIMIIQNPPSPPPSTLPHRLPSPPRLSDLL